MGYHPYSNLYTLLHNDTPSRSLHYISKLLYSYVSDMLKEMEKKWETFSYIVKQE